MFLCERTPRDSVELRPDGGEPIVVPGRCSPTPTRCPGQSTWWCSRSMPPRTTTRGWLARLCDEHTIVLVPENGVDQVEQVKPLCPSSPVIPDRVVTAETQPEGWVRLRPEAALVLPSGPAATTVTELLRGAGSRVDNDPELHHRGLARLLTNALAGSSCCPGGDPECSAATTSPSCRAAMWPNAWRWRGPRGARLPDDVVDGTFDMFRAAPEDMGTSILADAEGRRRRNGTSATA